MASKGTVIIRLGVRQDAHGKVATKKLEKAIRDAQMWERRYADALQDGSLDDEVRGEFERRFLDAASNVFTEMRMLQAEVAGW